MPNETEIDDKKVSSPSTEDKGAESSTAQNDGEADDNATPGSMLEAVTASLKAKGLEEESDSSTDKPGQDLTSSEKNKAKPEGDAEDDEEEDKDGNKEVKGKEDADDDKNEEDDEKADEGKEDNDKNSDPLDRLAEKFKNNPGITNLITQHKALKPAAEMGQQVQEFVRRNKLTQEDFNSALTVAALSKSNPQKAYEMLKPFMDNLENVIGKGKELPADLATKVAEGKIDEETAREVFQLRKQRELESGQRRISDTEARQTAYVSTMDTWVRDKMKVDPDYKPKTNGDSDGLFEMTEAKFAVMVAAQPPKTPADAAALAEKAYSEVKRMFTTRLTPKKPAVKTLRSNRSSSSSKNTSQPQTLAEAIASAASGRG